MYKSYVLEIYLVILLNIYLVIGYLSSSHIYLLKLLKKNKIPTTNRMKDSTCDYVLPLLN